MFLEMVSFPCTLSHILLCGTFTIYVVVHCREQYWYCSVTVRAAEQPQVEDGGEDGNWQKVGRR